MQYDSANVLKAIECILRLKWVNFIVCKLRLNKAVLLSVLQGMGEGNGWELNETRLAMIIA